MPRNTMAALIAEVGFLLNDPRPGGQFTDDEVQNALDRHRNEVRYEELDEVYSVLPSGAVEYKVFSSPHNYWEDTVVLTDGSFNVLTPNTSDLVNGRWEFTASQTRLPILVTGFYYDVYLAAADLCEVWASRVKLKVDFSADGQSVSLHQQYETLNDMANFFRTKSAGGFQQARMVRSDLNYEPPLTRREHY